MNDYLIEQVKVISESEQVAFVVTRAGKFVVGSIPKKFTDARVANIVRAIGSYEEAVAWFNNSRGVTVN